VELPELTKPSEPKAIEISEMAKSLADKFQI
jgi:hypothetical protein